MANVCFSIPGNIKQQMLPFVLDPDAVINSNVTGSASLNNAGVGPQWFSFKDKSGDNIKGGFGKLQICPSTLNDVNFGNYFGKDISYKLLFGRDHSGRETSESITLTDIFNTMPAVQIREFLPDTRLDQCINLINDIFSELWNSGKQIIGGLGDTLKGMLSDNASWKARGQEFENILNSAFDFIVGNVDKPNFFVDSSGKYRFSDDNGVGKIYSDPESSWSNINLKILKFPFMMYYRLQSCVTTNIYELPGMLDSKTIFSSTGSSGWKGRQGIGAAALSDGILGKLPIVKSIIDKTISNVQIHWMPLWDPKQGQDVAHPKISIKFDLFNDTAEAAMKNFIFVNTIVPNNMFIQYGMFQHSSPLYDVKIAGLERLYACSGSATVNYGGQLRTPPRQWVWDLVQKHSNASSDKKNGGQIDKMGLYWQIMDNDLIKIPDIYSVQMEFESLLPNNFNSYLFNYTHNMKLETTHIDKNTYQPSFLAPDIMNSALKDFQKYMDTQIKTSLSNIKSADEKAAAEAKAKKDAKAKKAAKE